MNIQSLVNEIRGYVNEPNTIASEDRLFDDTEIIGYIKRSINDLCIDSDINYYIYELTVTSISVLDYSFTDISGNTNIRMLDTSFILYHSLSWGDDEYCPLLKTTPLDYYNLKNTSTTYITSTIYGDTIRLNIAPQVGDKIVVAGRWSKPEVDSLTNDYPLNAICEDASVKYATAMCLYKAEKYEAGDRWLLQYKDRKSNLVEKSAKLIRSNANRAMSPIKTTTGYNGEVRVTA